MFDTAARTLGRAATAAVLSLALSLGYLTVEALPARAATIYEIWDDGLAACVAEAIPGYSGDGYSFDEAQLVAITTLDCSNRDIYDLTYLTGLRNVTTANFSGNHISDPAGLIELFSLQSLNLANNQLTTASGIANSTLTTLDISGNHVLDLSPLESAPNLASVTATGQTGSWTISVNEATALPLSAVGTQPLQSVISSDASLTITDGAATGTMAGTYTITFSDDQYGVSFAGTLTTIVDAGPITIPDAGFAACLDSKLGVTGNVFSSVDLAGITSLDCSDRNISDLTGAVHLTGATSLNFSHNAISNPAPLGANAALTSLDLSYNLIKSVNPVPSSKLVSITISYNQIADVSPFATYPDLTTIDASGQSLTAAVEAGTATDLVVKDYSGAEPTFSWPTGITYDAGQVTADPGIYSVAFSSTSGAKTYSGTLTVNAHTDVSFVDSNLAQCVAVALNLTPSTRTFSNLDLATIYSLSCSGQGVYSLEGLQYLPNLVWADLSRNLITDLSPFAELRLLYDLDLSDNRITDLAQLAGATTLNNLNVNNNASISSLSALSALAELRNLKASNLRLTSLDGLSGKPYLVSVYVANSRITSLSPLVDLPRLQTVDASGNQLTSLAELTNSKATGTFKLLDVSSNQLTSLAGIEKLTKLQTLRASSNQISDLTPLAAMTRLSFVELSHNQLSSLDGLSGLPLVLSVKVASNQLTDVSALSSLYMLTTLDVSDNQLSDLSPLSGLASLYQINARNQHPTVAVYPTFTAELGLKDSAGSLPTLGSLPDGLSVDAGAVTASSEGNYTVSFASGDFSATGIEFSGAITVTAAYNTFTTATPTITGTPKVDSTLTAHTGTWSPEPTFTYQWNADGVAIDSATSATFVPTATEVGKAITVTVTGTKDTYASTPVTSAATDAVAQATFIAPSKVTVSGWYTVGETLTASATWSPTPDSVTYTWLRDDVPIDGADAATYTLTAADSGHSIAAQIAVSKSGYVTDALTSATHTVVDGVAFPDAQLAACIGNTLGAVKANYSNQELATLTSLNCEGMTITDLTGAEALTGLTSLNLRGNAITDFSPISSLTGLQSLNVSYTGITNLDAFSHLTGLASLDASSNAITDISGISGLTGLTTLDLSNNRLASLSALSGLTELTTLDASGNEIGDLSPLAGLSKLATPDLTNQNPTVRGEAGEEVSNPIQGLSGGFTTYNLPDGVTLVDGVFSGPAGVYSIPFSVATEEGGAAYFTGYLRFESHADVFVADLGFAGCLASSLNLPSTTQTFSNIDLAGIFDLSCAGRGIYSIDGAQYLTGLASADFDDNAISDLSPLAGLKTALTSLKLRENLLSSVAALADHTALQNLYLSGNSLSDLSALASVPDLRNVEVSNNSLASLDGLGNHANLLSVYANGNDLTDISALATLPRVATVEVANNQLTDLSPLSTSTATTRLKTLDISGNRVASISTLSVFTKLATLRAANNKISDLSPLTNLTQLLEVDVTNNQLSSLNGLSGHAILIVLKASGNQLTSVSPLSGSSMLSYVEVYDNHISDLSPLAGVASSEGVLNARGQTIAQTVVPQVATAMELKDASGAIPTTGTLPDGISVDAGAVTAASEGTYAVPFVSGNFNATGVEFSGTLTVTAAYNTFVTATPTITGTPKVGLTLTAHPGTWAPEPTFTYQWKADGADIIDATGATFTPTSGEAGKAITVAVTGSKDTYAAASLTSAATEVVAQGTFTAPSQIAISGTFAVGQTVIASAGTWSPAGTVSYQWLRDGSPISWATDASYTLTADDAGKAVSVRVSASAPGYEPGAVQSTATAVALGTMYGDKPVIVGTVAIGNTLQVGTGYWSPSPTFSLQWYRAGYPIEGATDYNYTVTAADVGKAITVAQTGTVTGYTPLTKLSDSTSAVPSGSLSTSTGAVVDGTMAVGQTLTAQAGIWTPTPDSFSYQWLSDGDSIDGATGSTYVLGAADEGHVITVTVTAIKAGYTSASATSSDEGAVAKGSFVTATPTITGTATFGHTLKAAVDPWAPVANLTWQWLRDGSPIDEATGSSYVLGTDDVGAKISVTVTGRLAGYADTATTSGQTDPVQAAGFTAPSSITISGDLAVGESLSVQGASWTPTPDSISYRWLRDGSAITGATAVSYVLTAADLDAVITVEATATKVGYTSSVVTSEAGDPVAANAFAADLPVISGTPVVDGTVTASSGGWSPVPSTLTYQWQADGVDIADATAASLTLTPAQLDAAITVTVTGQADGYAAKTVTSTATAKVAAAELVGSTSVTVSGSPVVGSTLTAAEVSWKPMPDSVTFQWLRGGVAIDGASSGSYDLVAADQGAVITVSVTAVKDGYRTVELASVATTPVAAASFTAATPTIAGSAVVDQTLTATVGAWSPTPSASAIQWKRDGVAIAGATDATYTVTSADVGAKLTVAVSGSLDGYADHTATSAATDTVAKASFTAPVAITVSGIGKAGEFLTADAGTWTPTPTSISYQWRRDGEPIEGATSTSSYLLAPADAGHVITVTATVTKDGYTTASLTSADGDAIGVGEFTAPKPTISGTPTVNQILTASTSAWTPSPSAISYQWLADGEPIEGATGLTYKLAAGDLGAAITFAVTGSKTGYATSTATSDATAAVAAATLSAPQQVTVTGELMVGKTLTVDHGTWNPSPDSYSYRWLRDGVAIDGATAASYAATADDVDAVITAEVTASKAGYADQAVTSVGGDTVALGQFETFTPWISGNAMVGSTLTANVGYWAPEPTSYTYEWAADGELIPGADGNTFTVTQAQVGKVISLSVTGAREGYQAITIGANGTDRVPAAEFSGPSEISVSGDYVVGSMLTADAGTWTPTPDAVTYQWLRGASDIADATSSTYTLTAADKGKVVTVKVVATLSGYRTTTVRSVAADTVAGASFVTATPTISGTPSVGETLTAEAGTWTPAPSTTTYQWKRNGKTVEGATSATYTVSLDDANASLSVVVTGSKAGYNDATATSAATATVAAGQFTAPDAVTVTGSRVVGETLTADAGTWSPEPTLTYQWFRDASAIRGAFGSAYTLTADDLNADITVEVTGAAAGYDDLTITSASATVIAAGTITTSQPTILGQAQVGRTLTAKTDGWSPTPTAVSYQWYLDGEEITGATEATYEVQASDVGASLTVRVSGSRPGYQDTAVVESDPVEVSAAGHFATPEEIAVTGSYAVGSVLRASVGSWSPAPTTVTYQWLRSGAVVAGATDADYQLSAADLGKVITVKVTGAKAGFTTASVRSSAPVAVGQGAFSVGTVAVTGIPQLGQTLRVDTGRWNPTPSVIRYQWYRSGVAIPGATAATYAVSAADVWKSMSVAITVSRDGYRTTSATSRATTAVPQGVLAGPTPKITGKTKVKKTLRVVVGTWSATPDKITYRWYRNGKPIKKATKSSYKLTKSDRKKRITVKVWVWKAGYATRSITSARTAKVK